MSFTNGQYGDDRYLIYQFGENDIIETMSFGQITNNTIDGLAPATFTQMDTTKSIMYKITSKISLDDFLQKPIKKKHLLQVLSGIVKSIRSAQEYMIDPGMILLNKEYIFLKLSTFEMHLVCLPVVNSGYRSAGLQEFLWELVAKTAKDKSESREYVSELMEKLDTSEPLSLDGIESILEEFNQRDEQPVSEPVKKTPAPKVEIKSYEPEISNPEPQSFIPAEPVVKQAVMIPSAGNEDVPADTGKASTSPWGRLFKRQKKEEKPKKAESSKLMGRNSEKKQNDADNSDRGRLAFDIPGADVGEHVSDESKPKRYPAVSKSRKVDEVVEKSSIPVNSYGGTVVLHDQGNETMLEEQVMDIPVNVKTVAHLIRVSNNEIIPIKGTVFQIGSDYEYSDYQISNNKTVGDTHARIVMRQNEYYIKDINSKNHTYVDDKVIPSMVETKLNHGSRVLLGSERFVFHLY